jgi:hypothetical protein
MKARNWMAVWTCAALLGVAAMGCATSTEAPRNDDDSEEVNQGALSNEQTALADLAQAQVDAAAQQYEGKPNILVGLAPKEDSRLVVLPNVSNGPRTPESIRADLTAVGVSEQGAARIAGLYRSIYESSSYYVKGSEIYFIKSEADAAKADGIVFHTIKVFSECSSATVSAFDLAGARVLKVSDGACS